MIKFTQVSLRRGPRLLFESAEQMGAGLAAHGKEIGADITNYTNCTPGMSFSEVEVSLG